MNRSEAGKLNPLIGYLGEVTLNNVDVVCTLLEQEEIPTPIRKILISFVEAATGFESQTEDNPQVH